MASQPNVADRFTYFIDRAGKEEMREVAIDNAAHYAQVRTPHRVVNFDDEVESNLNNFDDHVTLAYLDYSLHHNYSQDPSSNYRGSGSVCASHAALVITNGSHIPTIMELCRQGAAVDQVKTKTLSYAGDDDPTYTEQHVFGDCNITQVSPGQYLSLVVIRFQELVVKVTDLDQEDGSDNGNVEFTFSLRTGGADVDAESDSPE